MDILYLSHCAPFPPDKGEKFRAHFESRYLARQFRVHLACFARNPSEVDATVAAGDQFASVHVELLSTRRALATAAVRFGLGDCLNERFYTSRALMNYVEGLAARIKLSSAVAYSVVMVPYIPAGVPCVLDMQDVDSEKWFQYSSLRWPGFLYRTEAKRLRKREIELSRRATRTFFTTRKEENLFRSFAGEALPTATMENAVDFERYDPLTGPRLPELQGRRFVVFVGTMDYYPNVDAVCWFAESVFGELRKLDRSLEFLIVGRNPSRQVLGLQKMENVTVTGTVADPRPYLADALAFVAPMQMARGIQTKVLEAIAMGKWTLASPGVCASFGPDLPLGIIECLSAQDYCDSLRRDLPTFDAAVREEGRQRFSWEKNLAALIQEVEQASRPC
jgi:sugar transferase (PEP-CTERM/EpsH1 system associated)